MKPRYNEKIFFALIIEKYVKKTRYNENLAFGYNEVPLYRNDNKLNNNSVVSK